MGAALAWALATLAAARASRVLGPWSTTGLVVFIGLLVTLPLLVVETPLAAGRGEDLAWLAVAGLGYTVGMVFNYTALTGGKVPVTAPIVSTEGSIAAALAVLTGEAASPLLGAMLVLIAVGVFVVALQPGGGADVLTAAAPATSASPSWPRSSSASGCTAPVVPARACRRAGSWPPAVSPAWPC